MEIVYISTDENSEDIFIQLLANAIFQIFAELLRLRSINMKNRKNKNIHWVL